MMHVYKEPGKPAPCLLIPRNGSTPEGIVVEKVVAATQLLLDYDRRFVGIEKGLELVIMQDNDT